MSTPVPLWDRPLPARAGRGPAPDRVAIAHAAFAFAEAEGLSAISVKRVAGRLRIPAAQLQLYLTSRDELLDLMLEVALGEVRMPVPGGDWQVQLWDLAHATRDVVQRRPWLAALLGTRPATGPNGLRFTEHALESMRELDVDVATMAHCVEAVLVQVCGSARTRERATGPDLVDYLATRVTPVEFPMLSELFRRPSAMGADEVFDAGLSYLLAGIDAAVANPQSARRVPDARERAGTQQRVAE